MPVKLLVGWRGQLLGGLLLCAALGSATPAAAQEAPREHVVRKGDTLWDLARIYLSNPFLWGVIYEANRDVVEDPHWIYPNERLRIPLLQHELTEPARPVLPRRAAAEGGVEEEPGAAPDRTRFYRPLDAAVAERGPGAVWEKAAALEGAHVEASEFHSAPWLGEVDSLPVVGQLVHIDGIEVEDAFRPSAHPFGRVYLRYAGEERPEVGERLLLVRAGRRVRGAGRVVEPVAILTVTALEAEVMGAEVTRQFGRVEIGSLAILLEPLPGSAVHRPVPVEDGAEGEIVAVLGDKAIVGPRDVAFVDIGASAGVSVGDEMVAYLPARPADKGRVMLPPDPIARLRVLRVTETGATVQVVELTQPELRAGTPVRVVARAR